MTASTGDSAPAIRITNLHVSYESRRQPLTAVDDVSFEVGSGKTVAIIGESGSGKSTLLRAIAGLTALTGGHVEIGTGGSAGRGVQLVFQDADLALDPRQPVWKSIAEPLVPRQLRIPRGLRDTSVDLLREVGLGGEVADRRPHELSGGQRQRVTIARALAARTSLVLLDEPVSAQDVSLQASLLRLLSSLQRQHGLTYVIVSHDIAAVARVADRVGVMYAAKLVEIGPASRVLTQPRHPYTRALIDAVPRIAEQTAATPQVIQGEPPDLSNPPSGCRFRTRCPYVIDRCAAEVPVLQASSGDDGHQVACHRSQEIAAFPNPRPTPHTSRAAARSPAEETGIATATPPHPRANRASRDNPDPSGGAARMTRASSRGDQTGANVDN